MTDNRVTNEGILAKIVNEQYAVWPGTTVTVCRLTLENGFSVSGESACVDPNNFDESIGRELAYKAAVAKIWPLEGYLLAEELFQEERVPTHQTLQSALDEIFGGRAGAFL